MTTSSLEFCAKRAQRHLALAYIIKILLQAYTLVPGVVRLCIRVPPSSMSVASSLRPVHWADIMAERMWMASFL